MKITTKLMFLLMLSAMVSLVSCDNQPTGEQVEVSDVDVNAEHSTEEPEPDAMAIVDYTIKEAAFKL